jgi:hypothetical protein
MKYTLLIISCCLIFSCSNSFINHDLKYEKIGDCTAVPESINMISNINGERYEFYSCIDDGFDGQHYTVVRKGDSVIVNFPKTPSQKKAMYKLILDVDAKPNYHHIILDERELTIVPAEK